MDVSLVNQGTTVDRYSDDQLKLATKIVEIEVGERRDLPWMSGMLLIEVQIDESGRVADAQALAGASPLIDPAIRAARQWEFRPFVVNGARSRVRTCIRFDVTPFDSERHGNELQETVERELDLRPDSAIAFYNAGYSSDRFIHDRKRAIDYYQKAITLRPDWPLVWYALGHAHYGLGEYDQAIRAYDRALELDPTLFEAAFEIGWCRDRMEPKVDSCQAFERAARLAKSARGRLEAFMNLTESYARAGKLRESADARFEMVREMRRFVGIVPSNTYNVPRQAYDVAKNYEGIAEFVRMAEAFQLSMTTDKTSYFGMLSRVELAEHLMASGREADARQYFESVLTLVLSSESGRGAARDRDTRAIRHYWNGRAMVGLGRPKDALVELKKAVGLRPDWDRGRYLLGRVYELLGERAKAEAEFRKSGLVDEAEIRRRLG